MLETITAYEVRQQKDQEMRDNDVFWASKLKELEARVRTQFMLIEMNINKLFLLLNFVCSE